MVVWCADYPTSIHSVRCNLSAHERGIIRRFPARPGQALAILYFSNSLGAAVGVLVSGFVLVAWVGLPGTILTAGVINLLLAGLVWFLSRNEVGASNTSPIPASPNAGIDAHRQRVFVGYLACAALTGTASFMYEIGWIRMLNLVLGSSTHAFELMLSAFILGLALGGLWIKQRIDTLSEPTRTLGLIQIAMGALALGTPAALWRNLRIDAFCNDRPNSNRSGLCAV